MDGPVYPQLLCPPRLSPLPLEIAYKKGKENCRMKAISNMILANMILANLGWSPEHNAAFFDLQSELDVVIRLAHHEPTLAMCV